MCVRRRQPPKTPGVSPLMQAEHRSLVVPAQLETAQRALREVALFAVGLGIGIDHLATELDDLGDGGGEVVDREPQ